jgi:hypothetical protein
MKKNHPKNYSALKEQQDEFPILGPSFYDEKAKKAIESVAYLLDGFSIAEARRIVNASIESIERYFPIRLERPEDQQH